VTAVERLGDHRIEYLEIEGPIGGNRGEVRRIVAGEYENVREAGAVWNVRIMAGAMRGEILLSDSSMEFEPAAG
jgi:hypothetical protein